MFDNTLSSNTFLELLLEFCSFGNLNCYILLQTTYPYIAWLKTIMFPVFIQWRQPHLLQLCHRDLIHCKSRSIESFIKKACLKTKSILIWSNFILVPTVAAIIPLCKYPLWKINIHVENELKSLCVFKCNLDNRILSRVVEHTNFHSVQVKKWDHLLNDCWPSRAEERHCYGPHSNQARTGSAVPRDCELKTNYCLVEEQWREIFCKEASKKDLKWKKATEKNTEKLQIKKAACFCIIPIFNRSEFNRFS